MMAFCVLFHSGTYWPVRHSPESTSIWQLLGVARLIFHEALGRPSLALPAKLSEYVRNLIISLPSANEQFPRMQHTFYIKAPSALCAQSKRCLSLPSSHATDAASCCCFVWHNSPGKERF